VTIFDQDPREITFEEKNVNVNVMEKTAKILTIVVIVSINVKPMLEMGGI
jgi:hypothetical protein